MAAPVTATGPTGPDVLREVLRGLAQLPLLDRTTLGAAEALLKLAGGLEGAGRSGAASTPPGWESGLVADTADAVATAVVRSDDATFLHGDALAEITEIAEAALGQEQRDSSLDALAVAVITHALARGLDMACHDQWRAFWTSAVTVEVRAGEAHPVADHNPRPRLGEHAANTPPRNHPTTPLGAVPHLRIASPTAGLFRVKVSFDVWGHSAPLSGNTGAVTFAACQPNVNLADFVIVQEGDIVHNRGCADPIGQRRRLIACVQAAEQASADFVVLPEYSLQADQRDKFVEELRASTSRPMVIVSGTSETTDPASTLPENDAWILVADGLQSHQVKMTPAVVAGATEGVAGRRDIVVYRTEHFAVAVLICRDATGPEIISLLAELGVNVLLVPAFSPRTGSIIELSASLSVLSQAFVVVAVGPAEWEHGPAGATTRTEGAPPRDEAAFSGPYEIQPNVYAAPGGRATGVPVVYTFRTDVREIVVHNVVAGPPVVDLREDAGEARTTPAV